jgi:hypothetical protein
LKKVLAMGNKMCIVITKLKRAKHKTPNQKTT